MTFLPGNKLGKGGHPHKPFREALMIELSNGNSGRKRLRRLAAKLIQCAENGEPWAFNLLVDRVDGKLAQPVQGDSDRPLEVHHVIKRIIVDAVEANDLPMLELKAEDIQADE
jgi:hypothetical protein